MLNLLDSHDMARFVTIARGDLSALRLATMFQMTYPGAPSIYYGDEIGLPGGHDPFNRAAFPWDCEALGPGSAARLPAAYIALRKARPSLRRGGLSQPLRRGGVHAHLRQSGEDAVVVAARTRRPRSGGSTCR